MGTQWTEDGPLGSMETGPETRPGDLEHCNVISDRDD